MTDEEYVFQQDVKERKKMKTGAMHRKCGAKSKKCTLPSDHLTYSQKKKLNGECEIINLNKPLSGFNELKKYSISLQIEYLKNCITKYGARKTDVVKMLKTTHTNFNNYCKRYRIVLEFPNRGTGWHSQMDERWAKFIGVEVKEPVSPFAKEECFTAERKPEITEMIPVSDNGTQLLDQKIIPSESKPEIEKVVVLPDEPEHDAIEQVTLDIQPTTSIRDAIQECVDAITELKAEEPKEEPKVESVSGYNAVRKMKIDLKGTKAEIMHLMEAVLGPDCNYIVKLDIFNADKKNLA